MDKYELKYKWEENKRNIIAGVSLLAGAVLVGGGILLMTHNRLYNEIAGPEILLAKNVLVHNNEGGLDLYSVEEGDKVDTIALPEDFLISSNQSLDDAYLYDKETGKLSLIEVEDDALAYEEVKTVDESMIKTLKEASHFETTDDWFAFETEEAFHVLHDEDDTKRVIRIEEDSKLTSWNISEFGLYSGDADYVSYVSFEDGKESRMEIGDKTTRLHSMGKYMIAHNDFGADRGESIMLRLSNDSLHIEEMKKVNDLNYVHPIVSSDENQLVFVSVDRNEEGSAIRKQLIVQNAVSVDDEDIDAPLVLELMTEGNFNEHQVMASNGFLYNYEKESSTVGISELRNGREYKTIDLSGMSEKRPFFLPIYDK